MHRKLIRQGLGGRTISLPIAWVRTHGLKPGDSIHLKEQAGTLILSPQHQVRRTTCTIPKHTTALLFRTLLANAYKGGAEDITLEFAERPAPFVAKSIKEFPGLIIRERTAQRWQLVMSLKDDRADLDRLVRSLFRLARSALLETETHWHEGTKVALLRRRALRERDQALRILTVTGPDQNLGELITQLEKIVAHSVYLAEYVQTAKPQRSLLPHEARMMLDELQSVYKKNDYSLAARAWRRGHSELYDLFPKDAAAPDDAGVQRFVFTVMRGCRHCASRLLALTAEQGPEPLREHA